MNLAHAVMAINEFHKKHLFTIKLDNYTEQLERLRKHAKGKGKGCRYTGLRGIIYQDLGWVLLLSRSTYVRWYVCVDGRSAISYLVFRGAWWFVIQLVRRTCILDTEWNFRYDI